MAAVLPYNIFYFPLITTSHFAGVCWEGKGRIARFSIAIADVVPASRSSNNNLTGCLARIVSIAEKENASSLSRSVSGGIPSHGSTVCRV